MSAETDVYLRDAEFPEPHYCNILTLFHIYLANYHSQEVEESSLPKNNRLKKLARKIEPEEQEDIQPQPQPDDSIEDEISNLITFILTAVEYAEDIVSKPRKKKKSKLDSKLK